MKPKKFIFKLTKNPQLFLLGLIILLGLLTRFYMLGKAPAGLYLDEAGQGYSAYSILKTGRDEFGKAFPVVFRSFVDFKTPIYIYLIVPLIPVFGLSSFTVRLPSAVFSLLTFPLFYLLLLELLPKLKSRLKFDPAGLALLASLLLAISPWHILFGRTNFECNVALFFFLAGVYFFYKALKKPKLLLLSAVLFAIAIPAYHSQRIVTPAIVLLLFVRFRKTLLSKSHRRFTFWGFLLALALSLPSLSVMTTPGFLARASGLNIFSHSRQMPSGFMENYSGSLSFLVNNSFFLSLQEFFSLYFSYFSPRNLFLLGDSGPRSSFPYLATFFIWQFPFYLHGLYLLIKEKSLKEFRFFMLALLLVAPLPAAVTRDPYSTIRSLPLVIPQVSLIALSLISLYALLRKQLYRYAAWLVFLLLVVYSLLKLYSSVIILNEHYRAPYWNYGWQEVARTIEGLDPGLPIVVDNARSEPYSQLLFFLEFDPATYQQDNFEVPLDEYYTNMDRNLTKKIGRITTRPINWKPDLQTEQYFVGDELSISFEQIEEHEMTLVKEIFYPSGSPAFRIIKINPKEIPLDASK